MLKEIKTSTGLIIVFAAAVILFGGAYTWATYNEPNDYDYFAQGSYTTKAVDETKDWKTYENKEVGFSFKYPKEWEGTKSVTTSEPALGNPGKDLILKVKFYNPTNKKEIDCANNEFQNWSDAKPTKTECNSVLSELSEAQKGTLRGPKSPQNIYLRVWEKKDDPSTLKDWLYNRFHQPNTELEKYQVGKEISMAGLKGHYSSIGCCGQSDRNYVIEGNGYVYSLGTNYFDKTITDAEMPTIFSHIISTAKLTVVSPKASASVSTPAPTTVPSVADWKTYKNDEYGFGLTFADGWDGYKMKAVDLAGTVKTFYVNVPSTDKNYASETEMSYAGYAAPFAVSVIKKSEWQDDELFARDFGSKVGEKGDYVFTSSSWQACPTDLCSGAITNSLKAVMDSFKVL